MLTLLGQSDFREGFIITPKNDTIYGSIDYPSNARGYDLCLYKDESGIKEFSPDQINGYGFSNDKFFQSDIIDNSFVEALVLGHANLYKINESFYVNKGDEIILLESKNNDIKWKRLVAYLISDCLQSPNSLASDLNFNQRDITNIIIEYNKCQGSDFIVFNTSKPWTQIKFGLIASLTKSSIKMKDGLGTYPFLTDSYNSLFPTFGLLAVLSSPRVSERVSFQTELHFSKSRYIGSAHLSTSQQIHDVKIDLSTLSIPLSLKYSLPERKYGIYFQGGTSYNHYLKKASEMYSERIDGEEILTSFYDQPIEFNQYAVGFWGGVGVSRSVKYFKASLSFRYGYLLEVVKLLLIKANDRQFSINLILIRS